MKSDFSFGQLVICDMANNHQGQLEHGLRIVEAVGKVVRESGTRAALKFQFRQLDSFIHRDHQSGSDAKHIRRFLETRLTTDDYAVLANAVRTAGLITMATPFDEGSVGMLEEMGIEVVKVASCSARDWPLLERVAESNKPVVASTAGLSLVDIDNLVSFFDHRRVDFAMMHCSAIYPTPDEHMQLGQIALLRRRYPGKVIGFSTHEKPDDTQSVFAAVAMGAEMLERHVGVPTETIELNAYSSNPAQLRQWMLAARRARVVCGDGVGRPSSPPAEVESLRSLQRGVYARRALKSPMALTRDDVYFAMPCGDEQLGSGEFKNGMIVNRDHSGHEALTWPALTVSEDGDKKALFTTIHTVKAMLNEARITLSTDFEAEFSHHFGLAQFPQWGCVIITCVNRSYCKKLIIQTAGQRHPNHYHKRKEETFQVLFGEMEVDIEGRRHRMSPGDTLLVQQGVWHEFWTDTGVIFEEISTQHYNDDSFYEDKRINGIPRSVRKTIVNNWGRYQI